MPFSTQGVFSNDVPLSALSENVSPPLDEERGTGVDAHRSSTRSDEQLRFPQQMAMVSPLPFSVVLAGTECFRVLHLPLYR